MGNNKLLYRRYDVSVSTANDVAELSFELDVDVQSVKGVMLTSGHDDLMYLRGSVGLVMNNREILPEWTPAKSLMFGLGVQMDQRFFQVGDGVFDPGDRSVDLRFRDSDHTKTIFQAYRVSLYVVVNTGTF